MTWAKFKDFLKKNLEDDRVFANSICSKFRQDSHYQAKWVLDWAAYLEHLQSILLEYDPVGAPTKPTMLRYFRKGLKPSVLAELEYQDLELESFDQMVKKTVDVKTKSALWPCSNTKKIDQNCPRSNRPAHSTISKSQSSAMKEPWVEKPNVQGAKSLSDPQRSNNNKFSGQNLEREEEKTMSKRPKMLRRLHPNYRSQRSSYRWASSKEEKPRSFEQGITWY